MTPRRRSSLCNLQSSSWSLAAGTASRRRDQPTVGVPAASAAVLRPHRRCGQRCVRFFYQARVWAGGQPPPHDYTPASGLQPARPQHVLNMAGCPSRSDGRLCIRWWRCRACRWARLGCCPGWTLQPRWPAASSPARRCWRSHCPSCGAGPGAAPAALQAGSPRRRPVPARWGSARQVTGSNEARFILRVSLLSRGKASPLTFRMHVAIDTKWGYSTQNNLFE